MQHDKSCLQTSAREREMRGRNSSMKLDDLEASYWPNWHIKSARAKQLRLHVLPHLLKTTWAKWECISNSKQKPSFVLVNRDKLQLHAISNSPTTTCSESMRAQLDPGLQIQRQSLISITHILPRNCSAIHYSDTPTSYQNRGARTLYIA